MNAFGERAARRIRRASRDTRSASERDTRDGRTSPRKSGLIRGFRLSEQKLTDVLAFFDALTDEEFITNPRFASP